MTGVARDTHPIQKLDSVVKRHASGVMASGGLECSTLWWGLRVDDGGDRAPVVSPTLFCVLTQRQSQIVDFIG